MSDSDTTETGEAEVTNLPQPPRPAPSDTPLEEQEETVQVVAAEQQAHDEGSNRVNETTGTQPAKVRLTLTVSRDLVKRSEAMKARFGALVTELQKHGVEDEGAAGLRLRLRDAFESLREAAEHIDAADKVVREVNQTFEDL